MPRKPDPHLEDRILKAARTLWRRGGNNALTLRTVARLARTNTPAVYRRFKNRQDLLRALLLRTMERIRRDFEAGETLEEVVDAYVDAALREPHEYDLFYRHVHELTPRKGPGMPRPIREFRPNFGLLEERLATSLGGVPEDHTGLALAVWAIAHGTTDILLTKALPEGHEKELRSACRAAIGALLAGAARFSKEDARGTGRAANPDARRALPTKS